MRRSLRSLLAASLLCVSAVVPPTLLPYVRGDAKAAKPVELPVAATIDTTLSTASGQIRQFAFDGNPDTYFASAQNAGSSDHFTLLFDKPVAVHSIEVITGKPKGGDKLDAGTLEVSG